ncbi:MAG: aminotransferase class V-fold PLP-dependent enzyme [Pseudomonadota bacterium]
MKKSIQTLIRNEFPLKKNIIYLANAEVAPLPLSSANAIAEYAKDYSNFGHKAYYNKYEKLIDDTRVEAAKLLDCSEDEIAFGKNTTWGIILASMLLPLKKDDEIIIPHKEFPANYYPWLPLRNKGIKIKFIRSRDFGIAPEDIIDNITKKTKLITQSLVDYFTGYRQDFKKLSKVCKEKDIHLVLDAIQGIGAIPFSCKKNHISFLSADAHKWMMGPEGISLLYINKKVIPKLNQDYYGWLNLEDPFDFLKRNKELVKTASRVEEGSHNMLGIAGLNKSLKLINEVGIDEIWESIFKLTEILIIELKKLGYYVVTRKQKNSRAGIISFKPTKNATLIQKHFETKKIYINQRNGYLRISPHFYNDKDEIKNFIDELTYIEDN